MVHYKLTYFDARGRAELSRLIFAVAGVEYGDVRISFEEWGKLKPNTPFGSLPYLEVDGKTIAQSQAIVRFLANVFDLAGADHFEKAKVDEAAECALEILTDAVKVTFAPEAEKEAKTKEFVSKTWPSHVVKIEKILASNPTGFLVGSKLTYADLALFSILDTVCSFEGATVSGPIAQHRKKVGAVPAIAKWISARPKNTF
ncbi:probable glutathione S-transferase 6 [Lineus longissimus]|uniref:probable glutathione S-transferase 6 n=1 Tax=Lineus longissimus TaxID=88925 RepID=UPI002B4C7143